MFRVCVHAQSPGGGHDVIAGTRGANRPAVRALVHGVGHGTGGVHHLCVRGVVRIKLVSGSTKQRMMCTLGTCA